MSKQNKIKTQTSLEASTERFKLHNDSMMAKLAGQKSEAVLRVADAPETPLDDATERARKYWDAMESKLNQRSSHPPPRSVRTH